MMTEETVRTAAMSADPGGELDRLVRAELATGRTTTAVYEELLPIVRSVRRSTKLSEDADECHGLGVGGGQRDRAGGAQDGVRGRPARHGLGGGGHPRCKQVCRPVQ